MNLRKVVWILNPRNMKNFESWILFNLKFESRISPFWNLNLESAVSLKFESRIPGPPLTGPYACIPMQIHTSLFIKHFQVMFRMNFLVIVLCFVMNRPYQFYYFVPLVSFFFLGIYVTMAMWPHVTVKSIEGKAKRSLMSWVVARAPILILAWHRLFRLFLGKRISDFRLSSAA